MSTTRMTLADALKAEEAIYANLRRKYGLDTSGAQPMSTTLGLYLQQLRQLRGWSLRDLAARTGLSASTLSRIETGHEFQFSHLLRIAEAFDLGAADLLHDAGYTRRATQAVTYAASATDFTVRVAYVGGQPIMQIVKDGDA